MEDGSILVQAVTDAQGIYRFRALSEGNYLVYAGSTSGIVTAQEVSIPADTMATLPPLVIGAFELSGLVTDGEGRPLVDASVMAIPQGLPAPSQFLTSFTAASGQWTLTGIPPGEYSLEVNRPGFVRWTRPILVTGTSDYTSILGTGVIVSGRVTGTTQGNPLPDSMVQFLDPVSHQPVQIAVTDTDGRFRTDQLLPGSYTVLVTRDGLATAELSAVLVDSGHRRLDVQLAPQSTLVHGLVRDAEGRPVFGAAVEITGHSGAVVATALTGLDGNWSLASLAPGEYEVRVSLVGYFPSESSAFTLGVGNSALPAITLRTAGTDDNGLNADVWARLSSYLGENLMNLLGFKYPQRDRLDGGEYDEPQPPNTPFPCKAAKDRFDMELAAWNRKERAFRSWRDSYEAAEQTIGAQVFVLGNSIIQVVKDLVFTIYGPGFAKEWAGVLAHNPIGPLAQFKQLMQFYGIAGPRAAQIVVSLRDLVNATLAEDGTGTGLNLAAFGSSLFEFMTTLAPHGREAEIISKAAGRVSLLGNLINFGLELGRLYNDYVSMTGNLAPAQAMYKRALADFQRLRFQILRDDSKHCPPPVPPAPTRPGNPSRTDPEGATDPNEKIAFGYGPQAFVDGSAPLLYTIHFENQPSATAPAQEVVLTDQLAADLDWSTFQPVSIGFNDVSLTVPPGVQEFLATTHVTSDPNPVRVSLSLNPKTGLVTWKMTSVSPVTGQLVEDPLAGFLPPNDATHRGEGYVTFTVRPQATLPAGTEIGNEAQIIFDYNEAIWTNRVVNTIDRDSPTSRVEALPPKVRPDGLTVRWSGEDVAGGLAGSGVASFDIYVSEDGLEFQPWLLGTADTAGVFPGQLGHSYAFYSVARDGVGHLEVQPAAADAQTQVVGHLWHNYTLIYDVDGLGSVQPQDVLLVINWINAHSGLSTPPAPPAMGPPYYDVNADDLILPQDVLLIINYINAYLAGSGEGEVSLGLAVRPAGSEALDRSVHLVDPTSIVRSQPAPEASDGHSGAVLPRDHRPACPPTRETADSSTSTAQRRERADELWEDWDVWLDPLARTLLDLAAPAR